MADEDQPPQPFKGFTVICGACGGADICLKDERKCGSEETGPWGSLEIICRSCGAKCAVETL